ncbi:hypothetical protein evm_014851 [Chilo suppressalis]|nr:hypothetical protein evm_014851 [Chilo suppressalis]
MSVNAGVPQGSVLSPTLFLLHINDLIPLANIHCYADDSTVHARYFGHAAAGQVETMEKRENLVVELNRALDHISEWGTRNLVEFNAKKTQACAFTAKTSPFLPLPSLQGTTLALQSYITMLGQGYNRGGWRGRPRGRGRGFIPRNKNTLKFDNDYDFEQANTEFEELRSQLAKTKISDEVVKVEGPALQIATQTLATGSCRPRQYYVFIRKLFNENVLSSILASSCIVDAKRTILPCLGEPELDEDQSGFSGYDKNKSFFDNISCEAVERLKGRSQRTDWRTERKLNSETFGVASARRGAWRARPAWRHHNPHNPHQHQHPHQPWRPMRGGGRGRGNSGPRRGSNPAPVAVPAAPTAVSAPAPPPVAAAAVAQ